MKNFITQVLCLMIIVAIPISSSYAQRVEDNTADADIGPIFIKLNNKGIARTTLKIPANTKQIFSLDGRTFRNLEVKQLKGPKLRYELYKGKRRLSSGYTTGSRINIKSDGRSLYYLSVVADDVVVAGVLEWRDKGK